MKALDEVRSSVEHGTLRGLAKSKVCPALDWSNIFVGIEALMCEREGNLASTNRNDRISVLFIKRSCRPVG